MFPRSWSHWRRELGCPGVSNIGSRRPESSPRCPDTAYVGFSPTSEHAQGEKGVGGWKSLEAQHLFVTFSSLPGLDPLGSEGRQEQGEALGLNCVPPETAPFCFPSEDLAFLAHHAGGCFLVGVCENQPLRKKRELFMLNVGFDSVCVCLCVRARMCTCLHKPACVCLLNGILFL